jgi:butyrate kinase
MSRKLAVVFLAMLVLVGAMGLKTIVAAHSDGSVIMANGASPVPTGPYKNGASPVPTGPYRNGASPVPTGPYKDVSPRP